MIIRILIRNAIIGATHNVWPVVCVFLLVATGISDVAYGQATSCSAIFSDGLQNSNPGSQAGVTFGWGSRLIDSPDSVIDVRNLANTPGSCNGVQCTASGSTVPSINYNAFPGGGNINVASNATISPGNYGSFRVRSSAVANLQPGTYTFSGSFTLDWNARINVSAPGTVRIFVNQNVTVESRAEINNSTSDRFVFLYARGSVELGSPATVSSVIYSRGNVALSNGAIVTGAITSEGRITLGSASTVVFAPDTIDQLDFGGLCAPPEPPPSLPTSACAANHPLASGLVGHYFDLSGSPGAFPSPPIPVGTPTGVSVDGPINFDWGTGGPQDTGVPNVGPDRFVIQWEGLLRVAESGVYRFQTVSDDGVRLTIGGQEVIEFWDEQSATSHVSGYYSLEAGNTYAVRLEYYENGGDAVIRLNWQRQGDTDFTLIPIGNTPALGNGLYYCADPPPPICPDGGKLISGLRGAYFELGSSSVPPSPLVGTPSAQRVDSTVDFDWGTGGPNIGGVGTDHFAAQWDGFLRVEQSGDYRFWVHSDDGVALWLDEQRVQFEQEVCEQQWWWEVCEWQDVSAQVLWEPHSPTSYRSRVTLPLVAGELYPIRMEYWEQAVDAVAHLRWDPPGTQGVTTIPAGPLPELGAGLYHCSSPSVIGYSFSHANVGITCETAMVTVTAMGEDGPIAPPAGTHVDLAASSPTAAWLGGAGAAHVFTGDEDDYSFIRYLQQPQAGAMTLSASDGNVVGASSIEFVDAAFLFHGDTDLNPIPTQVAGVEDSSVIIRAVRTDDETGACVARVQGALNVNFGFECTNPTSCVTGGPSFLLNGSAIGRNNAGSSSTLTPVPVNFNGAGIAAIPIQYNDVGRVRLHARVTLPEDEDGPLVSVPGVSNDFVVKPYAIKITSTDPGYSADGGFVAAGEDFAVRLRSENAAGALTPNFGNETLPIGGSAPKDNIVVEFGGVTYPAGGEGDESDFTSGGGFQSVGGGIFEAVGFSWDEVGEITLTSALSDYLGEGPVAQVTSGAIGRFYPHHFAITESSVSHACNFTDQIYLGHRAVAITYTAEARNEGGVITRNFDSDLLSAGELVANSDFYAEEGDTTFLEVEDRVDVDPPSYTWQDGGSEVETLGVIERGLGREAPLTQVSWGVDITGGLGSRRLVGLDMDAVSSGDCTADDSCTSKRLTGQPELRYGRLVLDSSFGPESANLPVKLATEYWDGTRFVPAFDDNCTKIPVAAIEFNGNAIGVTIPSRTVTIGGATTTGDYPYLDASEGMVGFATGKAGQYFTAPGAEMEFPIQVDLNAHEWLVDSDYTSDNVLRALIKFGSYRGHDRIIYWREVLE